MAIKDNLWLFGSPLHELYHSNITDVNEVVAVVTMNVVVVCICSYIHTIMVSLLP